MSAALRLAQLSASQQLPLQIAVIDKAREAAGHMLSGAVLDPSALRDLIPDYAAKGAPLAADVSDEAVYLLTAGGRLRLPIIPPPLRNHGNSIISLNTFVRWLAEQAEVERVLAD